MKGKLPRNTAAESLSEFVLKTSYPPFVLAPYSAQCCAILLCAFLTLCQRETINFTMSDMRGDFG
jgi:hypothetical protein